MDAVTIFWAVLGMLVILWLVFGNRETEESKAIDKAHQLYSTFEIINSVPEDYFLVPEKRKFPYRHPETGEIDCDLLTAAIVKAVQYGHNDIKEKAEKLRKEHCSQ